MRQVLSTALVALIVGGLAGATVGALAQSPDEAEAGGGISPAAVSNINADRVDGKHAVGAYASKTARAGKLVATNGAGYLPKNIINGAVTKITVTVASSQQFLSAGVSGVTTATCPVGATVTGGGFYGLPGVVPYESVPGPTVWRVSATNTRSSGANIYAYAICMRTDPSTSIVTAGKGLKRAGSR